MLDLGYGRFPITLKGVLYVLVLTVILILILQVP